MELRERRLAQIVRDFMEGYVLSQEVGRELRAGRLAFGTVARLVGDAEDSALFRLKEECHALFRLDDARPRTEVQAEELFDLAVGALFHETMKFREGFYLTDTYGPRLQRMMAEGSASGPLADAFWRVFEGGSRRMLESEAEAEQLFRETRDQLLIVLRQLAASGAVARSLVEDATRSEQVFGMPLARLLADIYGSAGPRLPARGREPDRERPLRRGGRGARAPGRGGGGRERRRAAVRARHGELLLGRQSRRGRLTRALAQRRVELAGALAPERFARAGRARAERRAVGPEAGEARARARDRAHFAARELTGAGRV